jgi:phage baseplate assembly protein W
LADFYDIGRTFELNAKGDIAVLEDKEAIKQSIYSIILTATGYRPGVGFQTENYGVGVEKYVFAQMTHFTAQSFSDSIYRHLTIFEPRISIDNVNINANTQEKKYEVEIFYTIEGSSEKQTFRTFINQL